VPGDHLVGPPPRPRRPRPGHPGTARHAARTAAAAPRAAADLGRAAAPELEPDPAAASEGLGDIDRLAARAADTGIRDVTWRGDRRPLPPEIDQSAFRVIQEAVTNVVCHSGTHACRVDIGFGHDELSLEVVENGHGLAHTHPGGGGFGLLGMRERVALLSGQFTAGPRPEGGFRVAARLPA